MTTFNTFLICCFAATACATLIFLVETMVAFWFHRADTLGQCGIEPMATRDEAADVLWDQAA